MNLKESDLEKYFNILELLFDTLPYVFWKDKDGKYQGANQNQALNLGFASSSEFVGKTIYEVLEDPVSARAIDVVDQKVMEEDRTLILEEKIVTSQGEKFYHSQKTPIHNEDGEVIGLLGFSMDITEIKKQELAVKEERDRLIKIAEQVAHDIASPLTALKIMIGVCDQLPEEERTLLKRATENILDIANNLLVNYSSAKKQNVVNTESAEPLLVSDFLQQLLSEKRMQYRNQPVKLETMIDHAAQFAFIYMQKTELRRSLSNLINNAVDALENKSDGLVTLQLTADTDSVAVEIKDNGKGMPQEMIQRLQHHQSFTEGKKHGHGLGLQQVRDMLAYNQGIMSVESVLQQGTSIKLTFPRIPAANWIMHELSLTPNSIVVILDDENSIHDAWHLHFSTLLTAYPNLKLHHFTQGEEALNFFNAMQTEEKDRVTFLSDYELLNQPQNGLKIIQASQMKDTALVTSYYANPKVRRAAIQSGIKILPKKMASVVPIRISY